MPLANVFAPMGFRLLDEYSTVFIRQRTVIAARVPIGAAASADLAIGDAYAIDALGHAYHAGADAVIRGIVVGFALLPVSTIMNGNGPISEDYLAAAAAGIIEGCEDGNASFEAWSDNTVGFVEANNGGVFNLYDVAPDLLFRQSRQYLNVNGGVGTQFKALKAIASPADNSFGPACRVQVKLATPF